MRIKIIVIFLLLLSPLISFAQPYPDTCPAEARNILEAVGGCAVVDCNKFSAICQKCCVETSAQLPVQPTQNLDRINQNRIPIIVILVIAAGIVILWLRRHKTKKK